MEHASMSERILRSLDNIVKNDSDVEDFTIVPTNDNTKNKSPVLYDDHHLGLESWCIRYVYDYVCAKLAKVRRSLAENKISYSLKEDLNYLINGALFINPDVTTFWNMRRELLEDDVLSYEQELFFSKLVLTRKTKSNDAFSYRRWLINRSTAKMHKNGIVPPVSVLEVELAVCTLTAEHTPNNYHAWTHRQWSMSKFNNYFPDIIPMELEFSENWISERISEHSGYHYRQYLIDKFKSCENIPVLTQHYEQVITQLNILNDGEFVQLLTYLFGKPSKNKSLDDLSKGINYIVLLLYELLVLIESINKAYIDHESLWLHRRFVIYRILETSHEFLGENFNFAKNLDDIEASKGFPSKSNSNIINQIVCTDNSGEKQPKIFKSQPSKFESSNMYQILCNSEKTFISKNIGRSAVQTELAKRYENWLKYVIGFDMS